MDQTWPAQGAGAGGPDSRSLRHTGPSAMVRHLRRCAGEGHAVTIGRERGRWQKPFARRRAGRAPGKRARVHLQPSNGLHMRVAEKVQGYRRAILTVSAVVMLGTLALAAAGAAPTDEAALEASSGAAPESCLNGGPRVAEAPDGAAASTGSPFWQVLGISSLAVCFVLLLGIIAVRMLESNRRKRVEEELGLEARLLDAATDSVFLCDLDGNLVYANDTACRSYGYSRDEFRQMNLRDLNVPEYLEAIESGMQALQESGEVTLESTARRKDGDTMPVEVHARTIDYAGRRLILSAARDITERRLAEESLRESEERYRLIFDTAANLIISVDREGTVIDCNGRAYSVLGYTRKQIVGRPISGIVHPDHLSTVQASLQETLARGFTYGTEYRMVRKDGAMIDVSVNASSLKDNAGEYVRTICIISDITASRRMEKAVQAAYAELERVFNAAGDGMRVIDRDFNVIRVNEAYADLSGVGKHEAVTRKCYENTGSRLCHTPRCALTRIVGGEEYVEGEVEAECRDGTRTSCILTATPLRGPDGELTGVVETLKDITELRKAQEQLQHSQLLASLGEMTAGIAHEVNNPLGSVLLYSELLMAGDAPAQTRKDLKVIHDEAKRAARIMTDLLTYSRRVKYQVRRLDLHRILSKLLEMRRYTERVHNIVVSTDFAEGPVWIRGDSSHLRQLFMQLMLNAEEAVKESGRGHIRVTTRRDGEWARISVADNGSGIPPENLKQIFYPFFTTKDVGEGTGLGLSTCYGIVTNHNGLIRAENNEAGGATFVVELPLATNRKQPALVQVAGEAD